MASRQCHFIICLDRYTWNDKDMSDKILPAEVDGTDNQHYEWGFNVDFSKDTKYKNFEQTGNAFQSVWCCHRIYTFRAEYFERKYEITTVCCAYCIRRSRWDLSAMPWIKWINKIFRSGARSVSAQNRPDLSCFSCDDCTSVEAATQRLSCYQPRPNPERVTAPPPGKSPLCGLERVKH